MECFLVLWLECLSRRRNNNVQTIKIIHRHFSCSYHLLYCPRRGASAHCAVLRRIQGNQTADTGNCSTNRVCVDRCYPWHRDLEVSTAGVYMMNWANVSETELKEAGTVKTAFGETLSWEYLCYVRSNPIRWDIPTKILYGGQDNLTSRDTISCFAATHHAELKVMEQGEHWFHTPEQMTFLDNWIRENEKNLCWKQNG